MSQWHTTVSATLWTLWLRRNERIFNNKPTSDRQLECLLRHRSFAWCVSGGLLQQSSNDMWYNNPTMAIKTHRILFLEGLKQNWDFISFIDGSWTTDNTQHHRDGIGGYIINNKDDLCLIFSGSTPATNSLEAETNALFFLLQHIPSFIHKEKKVIIYTDSMELLKNVKNYKAGNATSIKFSESRDLTGLQYISLDHIARAHNFSADFLAKQGLSRPNMIWGT